EAPGVRTKELVGPRSPLRVNGDIRLFADSRLEGGAALGLQLAPGEGGLASVREGRVRVEMEDQDRELRPGTTLIATPGDRPRTLQLRAQQPSRVVRVVHGPGLGFVRGEPLSRRASEG